jgi:hypothetical protein
MLDKDLLRLPIFDLIIKLRLKYSDYWLDKSDLYWLWRIFLELLEVLGILLGTHKDPIKWELAQIAAICINWMYKKEKEKSHEPKT